MKKSNFSKIAVIGLGYKECDFPEAEKASKEVLSLPMYPEISKEHIKKIMENIVMKINKGEK